MTRDDIIRMAREAGMQTVFAVIEEHQDGTQTVIDHRPFLERFANLVAAAKCEELAVEAERNGNTILAQQIRARGQA